MRRRVLALLALALLALALPGCSDDASTPPPPSCAPPSRTVGDQCLEPGVQDNGCPAGTLGLADGSCRPAGILPDGCAQGFVHDGDVGCMPVLPEAACPTGQIAVPGDTTCRPVMECGSGKWGDIPVEANTQYVDASYAGTDSDGSMSKPWLTINDGYAAAATGAIVAIAAGSYTEDVIVQKSVRLFGVCPERVEITGAGTVPAAVGVLPPAAGSELRGLALSGPTIGFHLQETDDVVLDRVWVHDTGGRGINIASLGPPTSLTVKGTLVEGATGNGVYVGGSHVTLEASVVRNTQPLADGSMGRGIDAIPPCFDDGSCMNEVRASADIVGSLIEGNHDVGLHVSASDATVEATVVRGTLPQALDMNYGRGINAQRTCNSGVCDPVARAHVEVRGSFIADNHDAGVFASGSDVSIESTVVRGTLPQASDDEGGRGIDASVACYGGTCDGSARSSATISGSLIDLNHEFGLMVGGSDAVIEATVVRNTQPRAATRTIGYGVSIQECNRLDGCDADARGSARVTGSRIESNHQTGAIVYNAEATFDGVVVKNTLPSAFNQQQGIGVFVQSGGPNGAPLVPTVLTLMASVVEGNREVGVWISDAEVRIAATLVRDTDVSAADGRYGDGIGVYETQAGFSTEIVSTLIDRSARAGVGVFGGTAAIASSGIRCAELDIDAENGWQPFALDDRGGSLCGCPSLDRGCEAVSVGISPPDPPIDQ
jgi:hypothetical protein